MTEMDMPFEATPFASLPSRADQQRMVEAIVFAATTPLDLSEITRRMPAGCDVLAALTALQADYAARGIHLEQAGGRWAFRTAPDVAGALRAESVETRKLSRAAIETLAIIAYHQPVTRSEIEEIRNVAVSRGTLDLLIDLGWVRFGRRRQTPGRPATFVTTESFLDHFGLEAVRDLPGLDELRAAGLLDPRAAPTGNRPDTEEEEDRGATPDFFE